MKRPTLTIVAALLVLTPAGLAVSAEGEAEIEMAKMADQKSSTPQLKEFARQMVQDHGEMGQKLSKVAGEHKIDTTSTYYGPPQMQKAAAETAGA
jgi:predicted outer membrane protein